jgi:hypothetical protein
LESCPIGEFKGLEIKIGLIDNKLLFIRNRAKNMKLTFRHFPDEATQMLMKKMILKAVDDIFRED